jgi:hypothetical protein
MHQYLRGYWAASAYSTGGVRYDYVLSLQDNGEFSESITSERSPPSLITGSWRHEPGDVLSFSFQQDGDQKTKRWSILYVTGCETSNCILVLRELILASRNLPLMFARIHPPGDPLYRPAPG